MHTLHSPQLLKVTTPLLLLLAVQLLPMPVAAHHYEWYDRTWAQESSDIAPDPSVTYGQLENGLRWALIPNDKPSGRLTVYLSVQAGSLFEEERDLGVAHYLEHMAFNGSRHFPSGSLIPFFHKNGMNFGGDTNAHTSLAETVYKLNLAQSDRTSLSEGLKILRDIADGLLIGEKEVNDERGVILSEKQSRENENILANRAWSKFLYQGTQLENEVIGTVETIKNISPQTVRRFYEKWYVPSRMTLVFAGNIEKATVVSVLQEHFSSMKPVKAPTIPALRKGIDEGVRILVQKRPVSMTNVVIDIAQPEVPVTDTEATRRQEIMDEISRRVIHRRLIRRTETEPGIWTGGFYRDGRFDVLAPSVMLSATTDSKNWQRVIRGLREEIERIKTYGLTRAEFDRTVSEVSGVYRRMVKQRPSRTNETLANAFVDLQNDGRVYTSPEQDLARFEKVATTLTLEEVNQRVKAAFLPENRRIKVSGNFDLSEKTVAAYWASLDGIAVTPPEDESALVFPYLKLPPATPVPDFKAATRQAHEALHRYWRADLGNGTTVLLQPLSYEQGKVSVNFVFGDGTMGVPDSEAPLARFAVNTLAYNGIGKYSTTETSAIVAGRGLSLSELILDRFNMIAGQAQPQDLPMLLQAVWTQFEDPVITQNNIERAGKFIRQTEYSRHHDVTGVLRAVRTPYLTGDFERNRALETENLEAFDKAALERYLRDVRRRGERILLISGDFDTEAAKHWASRLFGSLEAVCEPRRSLGHEPVWPAEAERVLTVEGDQLSKAHVIVGHRLDLADVADRKTALARQLATAVISDRLREVLREELGTSYSPYASYNVQTEHGGFGYLTLTVSTDLASVDRVKAAIGNIERELMTKTLTTATFNEIRKPLMTAWETRRKSNANWEALLLTSEAMHRPYLEWNEAARKIYESLTPADIERELKALLRGTRTALIVRSES